MTKKESAATAIVADSGILPHLQSERKWRKCKHFIKSASTKYNLEGLSFQQACASPPNKKEKKKIRSGQPEITTLRRAREGRDDKGGALDWCQMRSNQCQCSLIIQWHRIRLEDEYAAYTVLLNISTVQKWWLWKQEYMWRWMHFSTQSRPSKENTLDKTTAKTDDQWTVIKISSLFNTVLLNNNNLPSNLSTGREEHITVTGTRTVPSPHTRLSI